VVVTGSRSTDQELIITAMLTAFELQGLLNDSTTP
jgi:hypothetical protein